MLDARMKTFLAVYGNRSYTQAARELFMTQPAATQHVKGLEKMWGQTLFTYRNRILEPTEAGELLYLFAQETRARQKRLEERMKTLQGGPRPMPFGATLTIGEFSLSPVVGNLIRRFPRYDFRIFIENTEKILHMLDRGDLVFALVEGFFSKERYCSRMLKNEPFIAVAPRDHPLTLGTDVKLETLLSQTLILREPGSGSREVLERALQERNLSVEAFAGSIQVGNVNLMKELVRQGLGISFMYRDAACQELETGQLGEIQISDCTIQRGFHLVYTDEHFLQEETKLFEHILEMFTPPKNAEK